MTTLYRTLAIVGLLSRGALNVFADGTMQIPDRRALEAAIDKIVTNRLDKAHIPGAVVTIVKGNKVLLNKGYGLADIKAQRRVDPNRTLFRIASTSKVFNAMAAMRLIDNGQLDPDEDIRPRLARAGLELKGTADGPVTCRMLLSHSAGIRDLFIPRVTLTTNVAARLPLGRYLNQCQPLRWQNAGESMLYTDTGIALAGYVVELAAGKPFQEFVRSAVLEPLNMKHTCYVPRPAQEPYIARAYKHNESGYAPDDFLYTSIDPAVGVMTTGGDMARLLIAHLSDRSEILGPRGRELMYQPQFAEDERLGPQPTCGFFVDLSRMDRQFFHSGWAFGYQSTMVLAPSRGVGLFVAQNKAGQIALTMDELLRILFGEHANPKRAPRLLPPNAVRSGDLKGLAGTYVDNREHSRGKAVAECRRLEVTYIEEDDTLNITYAQDQKQTIRWKEIGPLLFASDKGDARISFRHSPDGTSVYLIGYSGDGAYKRVKQPH